MATRGIIPKIFVRLPGKEINDRLNMEFLDHEIKKAFKQMDLRKASGIDGLSRNFYEENWDVVGNDIINLCHGVLRGDRSADCLNETILSLSKKLKSLLI
ncbi:hypothetical protein PVK06_009002 [Gossypium arboreum]|uniref:Reverse transcriptase n=1 Tax=Gossypium arboreum TaxID=29729 RepID=A0ABR0QM65_GOSAR|nr:hypothetical protein PVK06_009002 [Gossypium arboreum]